jgi:hypothetical protein
MCSCTSGTPTCSRSATPCSLDGSGARLVLRRLDWRHAERQKAPLDRADDQTKIVPASGPVMTKGRSAGELRDDREDPRKLVALLKKGNAREHDRREGRGRVQGRDAGDAATFLYVAYRGCGRMRGSSAALSKSALCLLLFALGAARADAQPSDRIRRSSTLLRDLPQPAAEDSAKLELDRLDLAHQRKTRSHGARRSQAARAG